MARLIEVSRFERMRMRDYVDPSLIDPLENWEFLDQISIGEAIGFSEWLRRTDAPEVLWSLSLDLLTFPAVRRVLDELGLNELGLGATRDEVRALFGTEKRESFRLEDRITLEFAVSHYMVYCTTKYDGGLIYLTIHTGDQL